MKFIKIYLVVVTILLFLGIGLGVYVWYTLQTIDTEMREVTIPKTSETASDSNGEVSDPDPRLDASTEVPIDAPTTINLSSLPSEQRALLETFGITGDTFIVTPTMYTCAEDAVGGVRLDAIIGGSAPTPFESLKLLPCFKS